MAPGIPQKRPPTISPPVPPDDLVTVFSLLASSISIISFIQ